MSLPKCTFWPFVRTRQREDELFRWSPLVVKNVPASAGDARDAGLIPESGRSFGGGQGNPLQDSCLENPLRQRSLAGYSPWGRKESDVTEHTHREREDSKTKGKGWKCIPTKFIPPKRECVNQLMNLQDVKWEMGFFCYLCWVKIFCYKTDQWKLKGMPLLIPYFKKLHWVNK